MDGWESIYFYAFMGNFSFAEFSDSLNSVIVCLWPVSLVEQYYIFWPFVLVLLLPSQKKWFYGFIFFHNNPR